jgi:predicted dehydrogenase
MTENFSRRKFIATGALALSGLVTLGLPAFGKPGAKEVIRVGLIGTGARGAGLAGMLKNMPGIELVACCDIIPQNLERGMRLAAKGAKAYTDYRPLLDDKSIAAVIIATPLYLHYRMAADALEAGKHIFLEKSLAYDIPQTLDLVKKVERSNLVFLVGFQYRYFNMYHKVKEIIAQNWLGRITHFECQYNQNSDWRKPVSDPKMERIVNWRMYREYCGGPLSELCAHEIDVVNFLLDAHPSKVVGMGDVNYWKDGRETYDNIRTIYEYPNGVKSTVTSVLSNAYKDYNIRIMGDKATLDIQRSKAVIYREPQDKVRGTVDGVTGATIITPANGMGGVDLVFEKQAEATLFALQDFIDCIHTGKQPASNVRTASDTSIAIHLGNKAAETGKVQYWKPKYSSH